MASHLAHDPRTVAPSLRRRSARGPGRGDRGVRALQLGSPSPSSPVGTEWTGTRMQPVEASHPRSWWRELLLVVLLYLAYAGSRLASFTPAGAEVRNGHRVMDLERALHIDPEHALNHWLYDAPRAVSVGASYFYMSMHYLLTAVTLVWLFRTSAAAYRRARTWLVAMTFPALIVFWLFPVAPPRTLPGSGVHDIIAEQHRYGWWGSGGGTAPRGFSSLVNENAAMPSLHVGWAIWVGWNIVHSARNPFVRAMGYVYPLITIAVVISTGNHYLVDVVAGAVLAVTAKIVVEKAPLSRLVPTLRLRPAPPVVETLRTDQPVPARTPARGHRRPSHPARAGSAVTHGRSRR